MKINLKAGAQYRQFTNGKTLIIVGIGAASQLDLSVEVAGLHYEDFHGVGKNFKLSSAVNFSALLFTADQDCTIEIYVTKNDVTISATEGATVNANVTAWPEQTLNVSNDRGSAPESPLYVVFSTAPASALINAEPVTVSDTVTVIAAANTARLSLRITNLGPNPVAVGGAGLTWAMRCIVLDAGDSWVDDMAAGLTWYAITNTGKTASIAIQEVVS